VVGGMVVGLVVVAACSALVLQWAAYATHVSRVTRTPYTPPRDTPPDSAAGVAPSPLTAAYCSATCLQLTAALLTTKAVAVLAAGSSRHAGLTWVT